ncbi:acetyl-CoA carboxylase biotin carboxylase subunit family protein [Streptomyces mirabilis]|uniref:ATP-grasp domain-containing protein n=1 Tax=Streptomyces mirabilis TaxID=68239 RepID=UPI0036D0A903
MDYAHSINHIEHDVTYVAAAEHLSTTPRGVPADRIERTTSGDTATAVLAAVTERPKPDLVIGLSEFDLLPAAQVRESLGVPGATVQETKSVRDKVLMKSLVAAAGLRTPRFAALPGALERSSPLPWAGRTVLKPLSGASSKWTYAHPTLSSALDTARRGELPAPVTEFEVEEFVEGPIVHVDGLLAHGRPLVIQASRYVGDCLSYVTGAALGSVQIDTTAWAEWTMRCLAAVGVEDGPFHLEAIESSDGPVFLEVGARCGSRGTVDTLELATGVRLPGSALRLLIEGPESIPAARIPRSDERYGWFALPGHHLPSTYCRIIGEEPFRDDVLIRRWNQARPDTPVKHTLSYSLAHVPLGGLLGPASTTVLEDYLDRLFRSVQVVPHGPPVPTQATRVST